MAVRPLRRADSPLQEAHRGQALPVRRVQPMLLPVRPPGAAHEEAPGLASANASLIVPCLFFLTISFSFSFSLETNKIKKNWIQKTDNV